MLAPESRHSFRPGDKQVLKLLNELDAVKSDTSVRPHARARQSVELIHSCMHLIKEHISDHLITTTALWVLVSLVRMDRGIIPGLADAGVPGVLAEILQGPSVGRTTREYAKELTSALCSQSPLREAGSYALTQGEGSLADVHGSFLSLPGASLGAGSDGERSETLAGFVPYQLDAANADTLRSLFPVNLPPSRDGGSRDSQSLSRSYAGGSHLDFLLSSSELGCSAVETQELPYVLRGSGHVYDSVMNTPYATKGVFRQIGESADGRRRGNKRSAGQSRTGHGPRRPHSKASSRPHTTAGVASGSGLGGARILSRSRTGGGPAPDAGFPPLMRSVGERWGGDGDSVDSFGRDNAPPDHSLSSNHSSFDPTAIFADMTSSLAKLDPLCLNLSVGLHGNHPVGDTRRAQTSSGTRLASRGGSEYYDDGYNGTSIFAADQHLESCFARTRPEKREPSWVSFEDAAMEASFEKYSGEGGDVHSSIDLSAMSREWKGQHLSHAEVFNTAPGMMSEHLIDTSFVRQLFADGTTMEETQNLIFKMQGVFELFDQGCTGVVDWNTFTKLLLSMVPERVLRGDAVQFIAAQAEDPTNSIDYREFCLSGKVVMIKEKESNEAKKSLSTMGWQHRQQAVTGDASTYTWKNHVEWYRDRKAKSLIWLMRRASRAVLSFSRHLIAAEYLVYQGERARSLGFLMECGDRALAGTDVCKHTALELAARATRSRKYMAARTESQRLLERIGAAAIKAVQAEFERMQRRKRRRGVSGLQMVEDGINGERGKKGPNQLQKSFSSFLAGEDMHELGYSSDEEEKVAAKKRQDELLALSLRKSTANPHEGYSRIQERHYKTRLAIDYLFNKGKQAVRLGYDKADAVRWLSGLGSRSCGQTRVTDKVYGYLVLKGQEAIDQSEISDDTFVSLCKTATQYNKIYNKYLLAQKRLHRMAMLAIRTMSDVTILTHCGQRWLKVCNEREAAWEYLQHRRAGAVWLVEKRRGAISCLQAIPRRIWANMDRVTDAEATLKALGKKVVVAWKVQENTAAELKCIGAKGITALEKHRMTWAHLQQVGETARRKHFEKHWMVQSYNKPLAKEEEARLVQQDKDVKVIRRSWRKEERLKAEFEDAFEFLGLKPQATRRQGDHRGRRAEEDDGLLPIGSRLAKFQISKVNFKELTVDGKLLSGGQNRFDPSREFEQLDQERCGYISFDDAWGWLERKLEDAAAAGKGGLFGKKAAAVIPQTVPLNSIGISNGRRTATEAFEVHS